jgi:hypothetical protein
MDAFSIRFACDFDGFLFVYVQTVITNRWRFADSCDVIYAWTRMYVSHIWIGSLFSESYNFSSNVAGHSASDMREVFLSFQAFKKAGHAIQLSKCLYSVVRTDRIPPFRGEMMRLQLHANGAFAEAVAELISVIKSRAFAPRTSRLRRRAGQMAPCITFRMRRTYKEN